MDLAAEILADPTPNRYAYGNFNFSPSLTVKNLSAILLMPSGARKIVAKWLKRLFCCSFFPLRVLL